MEKEEQKTIYDQMYEKALELLPEKVQLVYLSSYDDNLNGCTKQIAECIKQQSSFPIEDKVDNWYNDYEYTNAEHEVNEIVPELKKFYLDALVDRFVEEYKESLIEAVIDRSKSVIEDLCRQSTIYGRIQLFTNYDTCNALYMTDYRFVYEEGMKQVVDALNINPMTLKKVLQGYKVETVGGVPDIKERDGNEYVSPYDFANMYVECPNGFHLAFVGTLPLEEMYKRGFQDMNVIIPKGTTCLLFNHWEGGGTCAECETIKDMPIVIDKNRETEYDKFKLVLDVRDGEGGLGYCTYEVYGGILNKDELFKYAEHKK